jgi:hypothetical protein
MFANQLIWAVWNVLRAPPQQMPDIDWHAPLQSAATRPSREPA